MSSKKSGDSFPGKEDKSTPPVGSTDGHGNVSPKIATAKTPTVGGSSTSIEKTKKKSKKERSDEDQTKEDRKKSSKKKDEASKKPTKGKKKKIPIAKEVSADQNSKSLSLAEIDDDSVEDTMSEDSTSNEQGSKKKKKKKSKKPASLVSSKSDKSQSSAKKSSSGNEANAVQKRKGSSELSNVEVRKKKKKNKQNSSNPKKTASPVTSKTDKSKSSAKKSSSGNEANAVQNRKGSSELSSAKTSNTEKKEQDEEDDASLSSNNDSSSEVNESFQDRTMLEDTEKIMPASVKCSYQTCELNEFFSLFCDFTSSDKDKYLKENQKGEEHDYDFITPYCLYEGGVMDHTVTGIFMKKLQNTQGQEFVDINENYFGMSKFQKPVKSEYTRITPMIVKGIMDAFSSNDFRPEYDDEKSPEENLEKCTSSFSSTHGSDGWKFLLGKISENSDSITAEDKNPEEAKRICNDWMKEKFGIVFLPFSVTDKYIVSMVQYLGLSEKQHVHRKAAKQISEKKLRLEYLLSTRDLTASHIVTDVKNYINVNFFCLTRLSLEDYNLKM